ncbi:hypothetical protein GCM10010468_37290 [Actinocorallia longicatena]|uniref:Potassium channel domain-containing protein n=1 Tax=Actinocorallia longicatena TaxID=111803 RepID=A0ABP6QE06_9ACTN
MVRTNLQFARMQLANCSGADLYGADLHKADLYRANLQDTICYKANLSGAKLERADLSRADLRLADLSGANLLRAKLDGTLLTRSSIGSQLIQENRRSYTTYVYDDRRLGDFALACRPAPPISRLHLYPLAGEEWQYDDIELEVCANHIRARFVEARDVYLSLQACFAQQSLTEDERWAHYNARRMQRRSYFPTQARHCYPQKWPQRSSLLSPRIWMSTLRFLRKWSTQVIYEATTGYGERPGRSLVCLLAGFACFTILIFAFADLGRGTGQVGWRDATLFSIGSMTGLGFNDLNPVNSVGKFLAGIESAFGISFFALYMFTLGNRMGKG